MVASMNLTESQQWMLAGSGVALVPAGFFIFFAITGGDAASQLVLRVVPIATLAALGWYRPQVAGWALIVIGIIFAGLYATAVQDLQLIPTIIVAIIFCLPLIASGVIFLRAHQQASAIS
ncbi:MAG TPA: hypothetical protein VJL57_00970 [Candidatus Paceibacterota bacterium]